jgi:hypothetical protein
MDVLADVHPSGPNERQHFLERDALLFRRMPTVVNQDIDAGDVFLETAPKPSIRLIAYENRHMVVLVGLALWLNVHPVHMTPVAKIRVVHLKTPPTLDSYFHNTNITTDVPLQVTMVDVEVVLPFVNAIPLLVFTKVPRDGVLWKRPDVARFLAPLYVGPSKVSASHEGRNAVGDT